MQWYNRLYYFLLGGVLLAALTKCSSGSDSQVVDDCKNPTRDNYTDVSSLANRTYWGSSNVHDPTCLKTDSCYYLYSTDAYAHLPGVEFYDDSVKTGHVQIRKSYDLVHWQFVGWAMPKIPQEAALHIKENNLNNGAEGIWAPYIRKVDGKYLLYYSVSSFGTNSSYIGLAESTSPEGPFKQVGNVVKSTPKDSINAIDPSIVEDVVSGKEWLFYGSFFGGIYALELDKRSGLPKIAGDMGHCVARRSNGDSKIIEAPEVIYNNETGKYYLFVSYDPLFTYYNVRVGRADKPEGPYFDINGNNMADTTNNLPMLTHSYKFDNHPGWSGNGHCAILQDSGHFFMIHQGRLAPDNLQMILHTREIRWLSSGWPVVSPERFTGKREKNFTSTDIEGAWEVIYMSELPETGKLWQGQIPPGGWTYSFDKFNTSELLQLLPEGTTDSRTYARWELKNNTLILHNDISEEQIELMLFNGWDWENCRAATLFSGLTPKGTAIWGKK